MIGDTLNNFMFNTKDSIKEKIIKSLKEYYKAHFNLGLNYEFKNTENVRFVYITGRNEEEENLIQFPLPIILNTIGDSYIIFVDLRTSMVKKLPMEFNTLGDYARDKVAFSIKTEYAKLLAKNIEDGLPGFIGSNAIKIFSVLISSAVTTNLRLNEYDLKPLKSILAFYYASMIFPEHSIDILIALTAKATVGMENSIEVTSLFKDVKEKPKSIHDLDKLFKLLPENSRLHKLTSNDLVSITSNIVMGMDIRPLFLASYEEPILFLTLIKELYNIRVYKKTAFVFTLEKNKKWLDIEDLIEDLNKIVSGM